MVGWVTIASALLTLIGIAFGAERVYHRYICTPTSDVSVTIPDRGRIQKVELNDEWSILELVMKNTGELDAKVRDVTVEYDFGRVYNLSETFPEPLVDEHVHVTKVNGPEIIKASESSTTTYVELALTDSQLLGLAETGPGVVLVMLTLSVEDAEREYDLEAEAEIEVSHEDVHQGRRGSRAARVATGATLDPHSRVP